MFSTRFVVRTFLLTAVCLAVHLATAPCSCAATKVWDDGGPTIFWNEDDNWDPDEKPQPGDDAVVGSGHNPEVNTLELFTDLTNGGTIDITTGTLQPNGEVDNNGTINIGDGSAINSQLIIASGVILSGSGEVVLMNSDALPASNAVLRGGLFMADPAVNAAGHTIRGEGSLIQHWQNDGTIRAEETSGDSLAVLRLDNGSLVSNGDLRSSSSASILLKSFTLNQGSGGTLVADTQSIVLQATTINGGELNSTSGGAFELAQGNNQFLLSGVTINAPINNIHTVGNGVIRGRSGGVTNNSTITLDGAGSGAIAQFGFTETGILDGSGDIVLMSGDGNSFIGVFPGTPIEFTQGANHTIHGAGFINSRIINNGTIRAEVKDGDTLVVNAPQTNNGLMEAASGAKLRFAANMSDTTQSASGVISAADGGVVELDAQAITGGTLRSVGNGVIAVNKNAPSFSDLTIAAGSTVSVSGGKTLRLAGGGINNNGTITLNSDGVNSISILQYNNSLTLSGSGEVVLNTTATQTARIVPSEAEHVLTQAAGQTIRGDGVLDGKIVNNGRIEGDSETEHIDIFGRLSGTGTLENVDIGFSGFFGGGTHAPGDTATEAATAIVPLEGSYTISHPSLATLEIDLGGTTPGTQHDQLSSTGTVDLGGVLDVSFLDLDNGYIPNVGDQFEIIASASNDITGMFNSVLLPEIGFGRAITWAQIDYSDPRKVTLEIAAIDFLDADFEEDFDVDGDDLALWEVGFSDISADHMNGDADGDNDADGADFFIWQRQFGLGVSAVAASKSVPEPLSVSLLMLALMIGMSKIRQGHL